MPIYPADVNGRIGLADRLRFSETCAATARTKEALGTARARGTVLGVYRGRGDAGKAFQEAAMAFAAMVGPTVLAMRECGMTLQQIADKTYR